ncbi:PREDICTED: translation initiation factor IF-2-like [Rhinopithecus bieti]|uniref:translation initiation factor IF-2-like n=1 Tax=Rhinopithecus bieti TaxID=61621 RepID=UPI00083BEEA7|nr:PREDICTED: translation initiation factor IF-2-like [Rhinopithecus bieti]
MGGQPNPAPFRLDCPWPGDELAPRSTCGDATYPAAGERGEVPAAHVPNGKAQAVAQPDPVPVSPPCRRLGSPLCAGGRRPGEQVEAPGRRARRGRAGSPVPYARGLGPWGLLRRVPQGLQPYDCAAAPRTRGLLSRAGVGKGLGARNHPALPLRPPQPRLVTRSRLTATGADLRGITYSQVSPGQCTRQGRPVGNHATGAQVLRTHLGRQRSFSCPRGRGCAPGYPGNSHLTLSTFRIALWMGGKRGSYSSPCDDQRSLVWWKPAESIGRVKPLQHVTAYKILKALQLPGAIFWSKETL